MFEVTLNWQNLLVDDDDALGKKKRKLCKSEALERTYVNGICETTLRANEQAFCFCVLFYEGYSRTSLCGAGAFGFPRT